MEWLVRVQVSEGGLDEDDLQLNGSGAGHPPANKAAELVRLDDHRQVKAQKLHPDLVRIVSSTGRPVKPSQISFDRRELNAVLRIYGFKVADGEWRDYAIDHLKDRAVFSVFRRASEAPLYRIEKNPKLARKQGAYSVISQSGQILKRGHELEQVLRVFEKRLKLVE